MDKVGVCHIATMTNWGGVERMLVDFLLHTKSKEIQHHLMTTSSTPVVIETVQKAGIPYYQPPRRFRYDPKAIIKMTGWLKAHKIQVLYTYNGFANVWGRLAGKLAGVPVIITGEHGSVWWLQAPMKQLDRWAQCQATLAIANSQATAEMLKFMYGLANHKLRVVYNAVPPLPHVDRDRIRMQLGLGQQLVVGSVGRLDTPKNYSCLVLAAEQILKTHPDVVFLLVGGGPLEKELRVMVERAGLQDRFLMTGWRDDARNLVQVMDIFVSTSTHETFGNAVVEAALAGIPAIVPAVDGLTEAVLHGKTGLHVPATEPVTHPSALEATPLSRRVIINAELVPPKAVDPVILAEAIVSLIAHPLVRQELGQAAKKRAETLFSIERYVDELETIYLEQAATMK